MAASVSLALWVTFWLPFDNGFWAATSAAVVCEPSLGASLRKASHRLIGTFVGAIAVVTFAGLFVQQPAAFLATLALWGATCALLATLLRNFAVYSASLAGYTAAIVANDALGATGGFDDSIFMLAILRSAEICTGVVCGAVVLQLTDLGGARRRLTESLDRLIRTVTTQFVRTLGLPDEGRISRRILLREIVQLDPAIDQAVGESPDLHREYRRLEDAAEGLLKALAGWRTIDTHLGSRSYPPSTQEEVNYVLGTLQRTIGPHWEPSETRRSRAEALALRHKCLLAIRILLAGAAGRLTLQLVVDQTTRVLLGIAQALRALALLVGNPARQPPGRRPLWLPVADWLPPFINAVRALLTISAAQILWVLTAWPSGALFTTWATIIVILFGPRGENAYRWALTFLAGTLTATLFAAVVNFAVLPQLHTFGAVCAVLACYLVPVGALSVKYRQSAFFVAMATTFVPLLAPANQASYDVVQFYNSALAICAGCAIAVLSFQLLPPLSPATRTQRLLRLTLRDLRRMAARPVPARLDDWERRIHTRLGVLPDSAEPPQRAQIVAALSAGTEMIRLARFVERLCLRSALLPARISLSSGRSVDATRHLAELDTVLLTGTQHGRADRLVAHARASAMALSEVLSQHATFFDEKL